MEINAISLHLLRIPSEYTQEYNRWYDLDHLAEHQAKGDVLMGRRYVAPRELQTHDGALRSELTGGFPPYCTIYSFGGPLDFRSDEARQGWTDLDKGIVKQGRYWLRGRGDLSGGWRVASIQTRAGVHVMPRAVPYLAHRGIIVAIGRPSAPEHRQAAIDWWEGVHLPDLLAVPGVLAGTRYEPADATNDGQLLHVLLTEDPVGDVLTRIGDALKYAGAIGRYPAHKGVYEPIALLPYDRIVPLEYDFDIVDEDDQA